MADYTSTATAYQQLRPIEDKTLENLYRAEQLIAGREKRRLDKEKLDADTRAKKEAALNKSLKDSGILDPLDQVVTGVKSLNEINSLILSKAMDEQLKIANGIKSGEINPNDPTVAIRIANLKKVPEKLKNSQDVFVQRSSDWKDRWDKGEISNWDRGKMDKFSAFLGVEDPETGQLTPNFTYMMDENYNLYGIGKGQSGERVFQGVDDLISGNTDLFDYREPSDYLKATGDHIKSLGKRETTRMEGPYKITEQTFEPLRDEVVGETEVMFGTADNPTDFARSVWSDHYGKEPEQLDDEAMQWMKDTYVKNLETGYDMTYKRTLDPTFETRQKRLAKEREEGTAVEQPFIEVATDLQGSPIIEEIPGAEGDLRGQGYVISLPKDKKGARKELKYTYEGKENIVDNIYLLTEDGKLVFSGSVKKYDPEEETYVTTSFTKGGRSASDLKEFNEVARLLPPDPKTGKKFKDAFELRNYIMDQVGIPSKKQTDEGVVSETEEEITLEDPKKGKYAGREITRINLKKVAEAQGKTEKEMEAILTEQGMTIK